MIEVEELIDQNDEQKQNPQPSPSPAVETKPEPKKVVEDIQLKKAIEILQDKAKAVGAE